MSAFDPLPDPLDDTDRTRSCLEELRKISASKRVEELRKEFHRALGEIWPAGLLETIYSKDALTRTQCDLLLDFLTEYVRFFRSGYARERACHRLKRANLTARQRERITHLAHDWIEGPQTSREFSYMCRLAVRADVSQLLPRILAGIDAGEPRHARRCLRMLQCLYSRFGANLERLTHAEPGRNVTAPASPD